MKRTLSIILALCLLVCLFAGCGGEKQNDPKPTQSGGSISKDAINQNDESIRGADANNDNTIEKVTQLDSAPTNLDPTAMNNQGMNFLWEVYEMPYQLSGFGGDLVPVLADGSKGSFKPGLDHEDGSSEYILYIRKGITDHAGNEIKASDVVFSYDTIVNSGNARGMGTYEKCEVVDDYSVRLTFKRELYQVGELTTYFARVFFFSEKSYNDSPSGFVSDACGTGPYKLADYVIGSSMTLVKNEDYWCPADEITCQIQAANVETIEFVYAQETASQIVALKTGMAQFDNNLSLADAGDFQDGGEFDSQFNVYTYWDNLTTCLLPNCSDSSIMGDINMRLAIFYAVNAEGVVAGLAADVPGSYRACYGMGNPNFPDFSPNWETWENYQTVTDTEKAQEYLKAAGYNGQKLKILAMAGDMETAATVVLGMLDAAGISAEITLVDRSTQNAIKSDPAGWDISVESWASSDFVVNVWDKVWGNHAKDGTVGTQYIADEEFYDMCFNAKLVEGHTQEAVDAVQQYIIEHAYAMGLAQRCAILVYPTNVTSLYMTDKNVPILGACSYAAE